MDFVSSVPKQSRHLSFLEDKSTPLYSRLSFSSISLPSANVANSINLTSIFLAILEMNQNPVGV